nr:hypothetical protein [Campylobacter sp.]
MKNAIISDAKPYFLSQAILDLEKNAQICIKSLIVFDKFAPVSHKNKIWWFDLVFSSCIWEQSVNLTQNEIDLILKNYHILEQNLNREKLVELLPPYEIKNIIFKFVLFFKMQIIQNDVQIVIFRDVPHGPFDLLLYIMAKSLKIKTLFFMAVNENLSNLYENLDDIGKFELNRTDKFNLEQKYEKNLPYMKKPSFKDKLSKKAKILNLPKYIKHKNLTHQSSKILYDDFWSYLNLHIIRKLKRIESKRIYKKLYKANFNAKINKNDKFVYFPLHLQPEATTDTLGGIYCDQILAIERLRAILPKEIKIYIKENPKQTFYMREKHFFDRLKNIPNIVLLSKDTNTYELMKDCEFVATITGTAGFEAISGGKRALVFGLAWYRFFEGVSIYEEGIKFEEIMSKKIDFEKLKNQLFCYFNNAKNIAISEYQANLNANFNKQSNLKQIQKEILKYL